MKIRTDFVTNSSSSSFVIMYKSIPDIEREVIEKYPFINNYLKTLEKSIFSKTKITTVEELDSYFVENYGWSDINTLERILEDDEYLKKNYRKYREKILNGYNITFKEVDYSDESTEDLLRDLDDGVNFIVEGEC